jgi:very-short-patch-repair endonuclease
LVIEVDGGVHFNDESQEHDDGRTGVMENFGIKVIRFTNEQVIYNQDFIIEQIHEFITGAASPALLGAGDGRG